ncbi:Latex clearing protein precursor [Nocardia otitidiscaviarum]|uniref:Latex clearing protein n=1 Tax=Nocardia otitidiscaviarum TaxID=1823 RepID=A0A378YMX2_9NOCA|nr:oxygenase MpaB family protein [Nocardia otitidiscaviarum]SUA77920.1 Latex clearing protein precursor [Nocardia otitidiscaviarum]
MARENVIPTEFHYWDRLADPRVQQARRMFRTVFRFDPQPSEDLVRAFGEAYYQADPVAEAFVDEVYLGEPGPKAGRAMLDRALEYGVDSVPDAPPSLIRLFEEFETPPDWLDPELVAQGAQVFRRWGTSVFSFATTSTLEMYSESSIAKPLSYTGGYAGDRAHKRQLETVRFWIDVSEPGGLDPGARGRQTAMRVRIMHVFIRRKLMARPEWDYDAWGVPISVGDATLTLMGGSVVPGLALWSIGHQTTVREIEATLHFWRYVGHLLGVQPRWYPRDFQESVRLMFAAFVKRAHTAGTDGAELVESYLPAFEPKPGTPWRKRLRDEINYRMQIGYTGVWLLPSTYARHTMPRRFPWVLHPIVQAPLIFGAETLRRTIPGLDAVADRVQRHRREQWYRNEVGDRAAEFQPVEEFRR